MRSAESTQLSMLDQFDKIEEKNARLLDELLGHITNIKFVRSQIDLSLPIEDKTRKNCVEYLTEVLDNLATLCWFYGPKSEARSYYVDKTRVKAYLSLSELRSVEELYELASGAGSRLKSFLMRLSPNKFETKDLIVDISWFLDLVKEELHDGRRD